MLQLTTVLVTLYVLEGRIIDVHTLLEGSWPLVMQP